MIKFIFFPYERSTKPQREWYLWRYGSCHKKNLPVALSPLSVITTNLSGISKKTEYAAVLAQELFISYASIGNY